MSRPLLHTQIAIFFAMSCTLTWWPFAIALINGSENWVFMFSLGPLAAAVLVIGGLKAGQVSTAGGGGCARCAVRSASTPPPRRSRRV